MPTPCNPAPRNPASASTKRFPPAQTGRSRKDAPRIGNGVFFTLFNISSFLPIEEFKTEVDKLIEFVKSSELAPGFTEILVTGEPESRTEAKRRREGIFVEDETWKQIVDTAKSVGVDLETN